MPVVKNLLNNGLAEVDDELAGRLVESGGWVLAEHKVRATRKKPVEAAPAASEE